MIKQQELLESGCSDGSLEVEFTEQTHNDA